MSSINLLKIIRFHIVAGGILAFLVGAFIAKTQTCTIDPIKITLAYGVIFLGDLSTHFSNDYFDVQIDKHIKTKKYFSGRKILVTYPNLQKKVKTISQILLLTSILFAICAVVFFNAPITLLFIAIIVDLLGWFYSAPPIRLSRRGFGEITVAFATGFAIPSIAYLSIKNQLDLVFLFLTIPFMLYGFILSLNLEAPDIENDKKQGKINLATKLTPQTISYITLFLASLSLILFLFYNYNLTLSTIQLEYFIIFSIIPILSAMFGVFRSHQKKDTNTSTTLNIYSLILFNILTISYLLFVNLVGL